MKTTFGLWVMWAALSMVACNNNNNQPGDSGTVTDAGSGSDAGSDAGVDGGPSCVTNPTTPVEILNACTTAQTGDPAKDYPYFPQEAAGGVLPPLP